MYVVDVMEVKMSEYLMSVVGKVFLAVGFVISVGGFVLFRFSNDCREEVRRNEKESGGFNIAIGVVFMAVGGFLFLCSKIY